MPVVASELTDIMGKWLSLTSLGEISQRTENEISYLFL